MHSETNERIQGIRSNVQAGKASISDLEVQLAGNTDEYVNQRLQQALQWFDTVEVILGLLKDERMPRTLAQESVVIDNAEFFLDRIAMPELKAVQGIVETFGPNGQAVG